MIKDNKLRVIIILLLAFNLFLTSCLGPTQKPQTQKVKIYC